MGNRTGPYKCPICKEEFVYGHAFGLHILKHMDLDVRLVQSQGGTCPLCNQAYISYFYFFTHLEMHYNDRTLLDLLVAYMARNAFKEKP